MRGTTPWNIFVITGTDRRPGGEAVGGAELGKILADLDEDQTRGDLVATRNGL